MNNLKVSLYVFALGITGGVGTLLLLIQNGAMLGSLFQAVSVYHMGLNLLDFVSAHGFLELSVIVVCSGCGFAIGWSIISPGFLTRRKAIQRQVRPAFDIVFYSIFWLLIAGLVEGYISPYSYLSLPVKVLFGIFLASLYWYPLCVGRKVGNSYGLNFAHLC